MKKLLLLAFFAGLCNTFAQSIGIQKLEMNYSGDSYPVEMTALGNKIAFTTLNSGYQRSLRFYDTTDNTMFNVGYQPHATNLNTIGENLFYTRSSSTNELWKTNGTPDGTVLVKDIAISGYFGDFIVYDGKLYFTFTNQDNSNRQLWVSDGTEEGTHLLKDLNNGTYNDGISNLFIFNGSLYFTGQTPQSGYELWKSDGTGAGTMLFADLAPGAASASPQKPLIFNNSFYFLADTPANGRELWKSDGTPEGTILFKEFVPGIYGISDYGELSRISVSDQYFIFMVNYNNTSRLWRSDGTDEGTVQLKAINYSTDEFTTFSDFTMLNGVPYFLATSFGDGGINIWTTDGTVEGTIPVINTVTAGAGTVSLLTAANNYLIFRGTGVQVYNPRPWVTNGTQEGTYMLKDISLEGSSAGNLAFIPIGDKIYFPAGYGSLNGVELWHTDGTEEGTQMTPDVLHPYSGIEAEYTSLSGITLNDNLIYSGNNGLSLSEPFISDGTLEGTHILKDLNPGEIGSCGFTNEFRNPIFTKAGDKVYFNARSMVTGGEIAVSDGTINGTHIVKDIAEGITGAVSGYTYFMSYNDIFYFKANDNIHGSELWRTDGTEEGTWMVKDINPGAASGVTVSNSYNYTNQNYAVYNGNLYFIANDGTGNAVWKTDGTEAGTIKVIKLLSSTGQNTGLTILGASSSKLFLASEYIYTSYGNNTLWSSDGTQGGTILVKSHLISNTTQFQKTCIVDDILYYGAWDTDSLLSLFRTDGTIAGTQLVKGNLNFDLYNFSLMKKCGNYIYFGLGTIYGEDEVHKLYRTDGTTAGTTLLSDYTAPEYNSYESFTVYGNQLFFIKPAYGLTIGSSLYYVNNGSTELQSVALNIDELSTSGSLGITSILGIINGKIYIGIHTSTSGSELYSAPIDSVLSTIYPDLQPVSNSKSETIILHPNPSHNTVTITSVKNSIINSFEIFDLTGKKILSGDINNITFKVDISNLIAGVYLVKIKSSGSTITKKLIKS